MTTCVRYKKNNYKHWQNDWRQMRVHVCASLCVCVRGCVRAFMLYALNFDKYVFVENV